MDGQGYCAVFYELMEVMKMGKVKMKEYNNARGYYKVSSPMGSYKVAGKEEAISMVKATRRLIKKYAAARRV